MCQIAVVSFRSKVSAGLFTGIRGPLRGLAGRITECGFGCRRCGTGLSGRGGPGGVYRFTWLTHERVDNFNILRILFRRNLDRHDALFGEGPMKMLLGGKRAAAVSGREFEIRNPATGEVVDTVPQAGPDDVRIALGFARAGRRIMTALPAHQQDITHVLSIGLGVGLIGAFLASGSGLGAGSNNLAFGIATTVLIFMVLGRSVPVTHHIALPVALGVLYGDGFVGGVACGIAGALLGEVASRVFLIHGDTHIDPPAAGVAGVVFVLKAATALGCISGMAT